MIRWRHLTLVVVLLLAVIAPRPASARTATRTQIRVGAVRLVELNEPPRSIRRDARARVRATEHHEHLRSPSLLPHPRAGRRPSTDLGEAAGEAGWEGAAHHPLRMKRGAASVYFELDLAGNVRRLRGDAGLDQGGYRYTAFGKTVADDALVVQPLRWKARWWQSLAGSELYDMRARQWSPELGSFLSIDEYAFANSTTTLWGWPGQSPARWSDPDGRCGAACVGAVAGGLIGGLSYAATASTSMSWGDFAVGAAGAIGGGAAVGALAGVSPQAGFIAIGALGVASDKDLWKLGLAAPLAMAKGASSCPTDASGPGSPTSRETAPMGKAPGQVAPGVRKLKGEYNSPNRSQPEPYSAHYDQYGRQIGRTDFTGQPDPATHTNPHHHATEYGPGYAPTGKETGPFPGLHPLDEE